MNKWMTCRWCSDVWVSLETVKLTPGSPVYWPVLLFVKNLSLYTAESLSVVFLIVRVQVLLLQVLLKRFDDIVMSLFTLPEVSLRVSLIQNNVCTFLPAGVL